VRAFLLITDKRTTDLNPVRTERSELTRSAEGRRARRASIEDAQ